MATLVCFHAHPDDEVLSTGGLIAKSAAAGHRVVVVTATRGEQGEPQPGVLNEGEDLADRRVDELADSCRILGAEAPRFLDYEDSGMMGEPTNDNPACFWKADFDEAVERLAAILTEVEADVLTIYDDHGLYGHPDHIQVHRVGLAAAERAEVARVFEATVNRDRALVMMAEERARAVAAGEDLTDSPDPDEMGEFGVAEADLVFAVDVSPYLVTKRKAMAAHRSQIAEDSWFLAMPEDRFGQSFAMEWFAEPGRTGTGGPVEVDLLPGLDQR